MIVQGNSKLGTSGSVWCFGIPAGVTCPGSTELCRSKCYAMKGFYRMANVKASLESNRLATLKDDFVDRMSAEIRKVKAKYFRGHTSGDFMTPEYVLKWVEIVRRCPDTVFWFYTRSWSVAGFARPLAKLAKLPNMRLWYSADRETGYPDRLPPKVRVAYLADSDEDARAVDPTRARLIFRDVPDRKTVLLSVGGRPVCPHENGRHSDLTCESCKLCLRPAPAADTYPNAATRRRPLAMA